MVRILIFRVYNLKICHTYIIHLAMHIHSPHTILTTLIYLVLLWALRIPMRDLNSYLLALRISKLLHHLVTLLFNLDLKSSLIIHRNSMSGPAHSSPNQGKDPGLVALNSLPPARGASKHGVVSQDTQVKSSSNTSRAKDQLSYGKDSLVQQSMKITASATNGFTTLCSNVRGWDTVDRYRPRFFNAIMNNANQIADLLGEQNRGVRTNRSKGSDIVVRAYTTKAGSADAEGNITIHRDHYNREDFPIDHPDAKFFVIKSYSEDDVHKSIKYNVWSSTPNGNKRLQSAYVEAQRISIARSRKCPVFLFFSVNASGQFCGVAEMLGPVDFSKDMDFWQQDKWTGSFPVKWLIVKDVPNTSFRHIILENNESKPVTNSRDTQEITYLPGINMLCIFKSCPLKTSILDDFMFYEERQRAAYEERSRLLGRSNDVAISALTGPSSRPVFPGTYASSDRHTLNRVIKRPFESERELLNGETTQLPKVERTLHDALGGVKPRAKVDGPLRADVVHINAKEEPHLEAEGKAEAPKVDEQTMEYDKELPAVKRLPNVDVKQRNGVISQPFKGDPKHSVRKASGRQSIQKIDTSALPKSESDPNKEQINDSVGLSSIMKVGSMSIDSKIGKSNRKTPDVAGGASVDVITVGSVHIKVEKATDAGVLTVGPIQLIQKSEA